MVSKKTNEIKIKSNSIKAFFNAEEEFVSEILENLFAFFFIGIWEQIKKREKKKNWPVSQPQIMVNSIFFQNFATKKSPSVWEEKSKQNFSKFWKEILNKNINFNRNSTFIKLRIYLFWRSGIKVYFSQYWKLFCHSLNFLLPMSLKVSLLISWQNFFEMDFWKIQKPENETWGNWTIEKNRIRRTPQKIKDFQCSSKLDFFSRKKSSKLRWLVQEEEFFRIFEREKKLSWGEFLFNFLLCSECFKNYIFSSHFFIDRKASFSFIRVVCFNFQVDKEGLF